MYLQIYKSFESLIPLKTRGDDDDAEDHDRRHAVSRRT